MNRDNNNYIRVIVRIWKKKDAYAETPVLIFPDDVERNHCVQMWEPVGQHGPGDPQSVITKTRPATMEETEAVVRRYEIYYGCSLKVMKRLPRIDWSKASRL